MHALSQPQAPSSPQRRSRHLTAHALAALLLLALLVGLSGCTKDPVLPTRGLTVPPPNQSVFLRASFDDDPSSFVGRFIPDALEPSEVDENRSATTRCSQYITYKEVRASGTYDETFNSSTSVGASLGVAQVAGISGGASTSQALRVSYKLTKKMRAEINNPAELDRCCKAAPDQCSNMIIGEFFFGSGEVYQAAGSSADLSGDGVSPSGAVGGLDFKDEIAWKRLTRFEDVYFAFRTQATRLGTPDLVKRPADDCSWANAVPSSLDGQYFVGVSDPSNSEKVARNGAMLNARAQAVRFLGEYITSEVSSKTSSLDDVLDNQQAVTAAAQGLAKYVKDERWCPAERSDSPRGTMYTARVLAFFPNQKKAEAAKEAILTLSSNLKSQGKLSPKKEAELKGMVKSIK